VARGHPIHTVLRRFPVISILDALAQVGLLGNAAQCEISVAALWVSHLRRLTEKNIPDCAGFSFGFKAWR
jgi:hypothetical protein